MADLLSIDQLTKELNLVNAQIEQITAGKSVTRLRVGSSSFTRDYSFTGTTLAECVEYRKYLLQEIHNKSTDLPTFRTNATIPNLVHKQIQRG